MNARCAPEHQQKLRTRFSVLSVKFTGKESMALLNSVMDNIMVITGNTDINLIAGMLSDVNMLFCRLRSAFRMPENGSLR